MPQVLSTSYGEDEQSVPPAYAQSVCNLFAQLASRGVSVIFSSGDSGVGSGCVSNDGQNRAIFLPTFPAACPWVTSVGATQGQPEKAAPFSSGGFSNYWAQPSWQSSAVNQYLTSLGSKFNGYYNASGRGFPDVSAQGLNFAIYDKGSLGGVEGTSCSAPTFSGIIGLLNDARLRAGLSSMGFLNPWLYSNASSALNDITSGSSAGCNGYSSFNSTRLPNGKVIPGAGWAATTGWDPVTGLGTPNFPKLLSIAVPSNSALSGNKRSHRFRG
jgi:tripeptidyl-peptidase-1